MKHRSLQRSLSTEAPPRSAPWASADGMAIGHRFAELRQRTMALVQGLSEADCQAQSMPDASPLKWHLAHVTWFFETFVLERFEPDFKPFHPAFRALFNSYYNGVGAQHARTQRGLITRPGLAEIKAYRAAVDERVLAVLTRFDLDEATSAKLLPLIELGLQHEQQHQELMLTDIKHLLSLNPLAPAFRTRRPLALSFAVSSTLSSALVRPVEPSWTGFEGGLVEIGHTGDGFAFDNESPRHRVWLEPFALSNRLVTHGEWAEFVAAGAYRDPRWWLSAGWDWVQREAISAPLYWCGAGGEAAGDTAKDTAKDTAEDWHSFTLHGLLPIDPQAPIVHISYFEADAYARWRGAQHSRTWRLPTEAEWEHAAQLHRVAARSFGNFAESEAWHPLPVSRTYPGPMQLLGDVWEWTRSSYQAYPGYQPWAGAVGEYNGKFMVNQYVLRGGSCATAADHLRTSYRNFFPTEARWQFSGLRLARSSG